LSGTRDFFDLDTFIREATLAATVGVTVCAFFLSLQLFEVIYFLVFMSSAMVSNYQKRLVCKNHPTSVTTATPDIFSADDRHLKIPARREPTKRVLGK
jgi:hypothetical protein